MYEMSNHLKKCKHKCKIANTYWRSGKAALVTWNIEKYANCVNSCERTVKPDKNKTFKQLYPDLYVSER